ncbi:hypothetical protein [Azospirillum agricola]|uniref:hypothetical protein n=1 Tax=Azospirillum agricola TaxID=1720247 RepID=UPI000A0F2B68|nr:hypothetical protein [Azospirillum agricola]SMH41173.1 hypothetical protein SAMN02982994_1665 [Azospirillum lipoferum]
MSADDVPALHLSPLPKAWFIDVDGVIVRHNGHLGPEGDSLLPGVREFWARIPDDDTIIVVSARKEHERAATLAALERWGLRHSAALFGLPPGERVLINDTKPSGLITAHAVAVPRDAGLGGVSFTIDPTL